MGEFAEFSQSRVSQLQIIQISALLLVQISRLFTSQASEIHFRQIQLIKLKFQPMSKFKINKKQLIRNNRSTRLFLLQRRHKNKNNFLGNDFIQASDNFTRNCVVK